MSVVRAEEVASLARHRPEVGDHLEEAHRVRLEAGGHLVHHRAHGRMGVETHQVRHFPPPPMSPVHGEEHQAHPQYQSHL